MKQCSTITIATIAIVSLAAVSICAQPSRAVDKRGRMLTEGRPFFTDASLYNDYHLAGSPLGFFEMDSTSRVGADFGFGYFDLGGESGSYMNGQTIRLGAPGRAFFELFYGPDFLSRKGVDYAGLSLPGADLTLQRFGATLVAFNAAGGFFRGALSGEASLGDQKWKDGSYREFYVVDRLRFDMGSQLHPLARIGFFGNATALVESLKPLPANAVSSNLPDVRVEDFAQMNLPEIGGSLDFGGGDFPVHSHVSTAFSWSRLVHTLKYDWEDSLKLKDMRYNGLDRLTSKLTNVGRNGVDSLGHMYAIVNDSFHLFWLTQGRIPVAEDKYVFKPGMLIGFTTNSGRMLQPDRADNSPFKLGDEIAGSEYELGGFHFGMGTGFELLGYADMYMEYSLASMSLKCGKAYPDSYNDSRVFHHVAFGAQTPLHKYMELSFEVSPRMAYFVSGSSAALGPPHSTTAPMNTAPGMSKAWLYNPQYFLEGFVRTSGFTLGLDVSALENILSISSWVTLLSRKADPLSDSGMEFGFSLGFRM